MGLSIIDIAKEAGVSKSPVSRVLNGGSVSEKSRQAVSLAIRKLEYSPNFMARTLRGVNSKIIGILSCGGQIFQNQLLASHYAGIMDVFQKNGYDILLVHDDYNYQYGHLEPKIITYLKEKRIAGLMTVGSDDLPIIREAAKSFRNVVYDGPRIYQDRGFRVSLDNYKFSKEAYSYLNESDCGNVLTVISFDHNALTLERRIQAYCDVKKISKEEAETSFLVLNCSPLFDLSKACEEVYGAFSTGNYSSILVDDINLARQIVSYFSAHGKSFYEDYSIVAFERAQKHFVSQENEITTLLLPIYHYGTALASLMIEVIENPLLKIKDVEIPYKLCKRKSVRNLKK